MKLSEYLNQFEGLDPEIEVVLPSKLYEDVGSNACSLNFEAYTHAFSYHKVGDLVLCDKKKVNLYSQPVIVLGGL